MRSTSSTPCRKRLAAALRSVRRRKHRASAKDAADKKQRDAVKILSFEGEVDPFQFTVLSTGPLGFFRKAWRNNLRYIQGFVVDTDEFVQQLRVP